jgi:acyl-CoA-binding protein
MKAQFEEAVKLVDTLTKRPDNQELLRLYALFKQATEGDVSGDPPGGFDFKGAAKYNAWKEQAGRSADEAMTDYIDMVSSLVEKYT